MLPYQHYSLLETPLIFAFCASSVTPIFHHKNTITTIAKQKARCALTYLNNVKDNLEVTFVAIDLSKSKYLQSDQR